MDGIQAHEQVDLNTRAFLVELTELSRRYGIAITGAATLFAMEMEREEGDSSYVIDAERKLSFQ